MAMTMTIEEAYKELLIKVKNGDISPDEAEAEIGAMEDNETAKDLRSAGLQW